MRMNPYLRLTKHPARIVPERRYVMIRARIGYLCRAGTTLLSSTWQLSDPACTDGALLRMPPRPFSEVYYAEMQPYLRNDSDLETAAVYFDPYSGRFVVVGSRSLYEDAREKIGTAGTPLFLENESPIRFSAASYGEYVSPDKLTLTYSDYFTPDALGETLLDCMVRRDPEPGGAYLTCAMRFFDTYCERLLTDAAEPGPDRLTCLLASAVREKNAPLLCRLFALIPQMLGRFRLSMREEAKFAGSAEFPEITLPDTGTDAPKPRLFNLFQYTVLCGDPDTMQTVFSSCEHPREVSEFLRHPMYFHAGFYHVRAGNTAALAVLLGAGFSVDCTDSAGGRISLISEACRCRRPAIAAMLVRAGADVRRKDNAGKNAFDYAISENEPACLAALLSGLTGTDASVIPVQLSARITLDEESQTLACVLQNFIKRQ